MSVSIVFAGTPEFAVPSLERLYADPEIHIRGVISRPDKPQGRKLVTAPTPVKKKALEFGLEVFQPKRLRMPEVMPWLRERAPQAIVVVAYGGMIPPEVLSLPPLGCLNLHPSLLPKYRGAAPIQWSLINGDTVTGISAMYLAEGWDNGDVIYQEEVRIAPGDDAGTLSERLSAMGADLMCRTVRDVARGVAPRIPQDESLVTWASKIEPEHERIDWTKPAAAIHGLIRGLSPQPGAYTFWHGKRIKVFRSDLLTVPVNAPPGTVVDTKFDTLRVATGVGGIELFEVQPDGKRSMRISDFLRGHAIQPGMILGE